MVKHGVWIVSAKKGAWEDNWVEGDVILAHKLIELNVFRILPPLLPVFLNVICSDREVTDGCIEPDIEYFLLVVVKRDWGAPLEISGDTASLQALLQERGSKLDWVCSPLTLFGSLFIPFLMMRLDLGQVDENVLWLPDLWSGPWDLWAWIN